MERVAVYKASPETELEERTEIAKSEGRCQWLASQY